MKLRRALRDWLKRSMSSSLNEKIARSPASVAAMSWTLFGVTSRRNAGTFSASRRPLRS